MRRELIKSLFYFSLALCTFRQTAFCQSVTIGGKVGWQSIHLVQYSGPSSGDNKRMNRFIAGPTIEVGLPHGFSFAAEALRKEFAYSQTGGQFSPGSGFSEATQQSAEMHSWEFPVVIGKYFGKSKRIHPYLEAGISERATSGTTELHTSTRESYLSPFITYDNVETQHNAWNAGLVLGGGASIKVAGRLSILPQVRFTRFANQAFTQNGFSSNQTAVDILIGVGLTLKKQ